MRVTQLATTITFIFYMLTLRIIEVGHGSFRSVEKSKGKQHDGRVLKIYQPKKGTIDVGKASLSI